MDEKVRLLIAELGDTRVKKDIDVSEYLQTGLGSRAAAFYIATTTRELIKVICLCRELRLNFLLIGLGSKIIVAASGFDGLAIKNRSDNLRIFGVKGKVSREGIGIQEAFLEADSGVSLKRLADYADRQGLGGLDVLKSATGTAGGSIMVNKDLREGVYQVKVLTPDNEIVEKKIDELKRDDIILAVVFKLRAKEVVK